MCIFHFIDPADDVLAPSANHLIVEECKIQRLNLYQHHHTPFIQIFSTSSQITAVFSSCVHACIQTKEVIIFISYHLFKFILKIFFLAARRHHTKKSVFRVVLLLITKRDLIWLKLQYFCYFTQNPIFHVGLNLNRAIFWYTKH